MSVPDFFKVINLSILDIIKNESFWNDFLEYKVSKQNISTYEEKDLRKFISERGYLPVVENILSGKQFSLPKLRELNKKGTDKKRAVFVFDREENYVLKGISYALNKYEHIFPKNLYSFRKEVGVKKAIKDLVKNPRVKSLYSYKVDIHDYFNSVDTEKVLELLKTALSDDNCLFCFISSILTEPNVIYNGEIIPHKKGIMAGVPISGFLANLYLIDLDKWFAQQNIIYARYSDDIIVFAETKELIEAYERKIKSFLYERKLEINAKKEFWTLPGETWEFLGFSVSKECIDLSDISLQKMKAKIHRKARALVRWKKRKGACKERAIRAFIKHFNRKFYDNPKHHEVTWCRWYFPTITTSKSLSVLDEYMISCIRYIATGKHTKANYNLRYEEIKELGYRSLVNTYYYYKKTNTFPEKKTPNN